jgi:hypothetical protein
MAQQIKLNVLPDDYPIKTVLLRKCIKQLEKLKQFGAHQVRSFYEISIPALRLHFESRRSIIRLYLTNSLLVRP